VAWLLAVVLAVGACESDVGLDCGSEVGVSMVISRCGFGVEMPFKLDNDIRICRISRV
jgi:hypothetical protein